MKTFNVNDFREQCLELLENIPPDGILITKCGEPVAKLTAVRSSCLNLFGSVNNLAIDSEDDLFSTGLKWDAQYRHTPSD